MASSQKRIGKELQECTSNPPADMTITASDTNIHTWTITLPGPPNTPYAAGTFALTLTLPPDYPFKPPTVVFATRIYHPNVTNDAAGAVCLAALKPENWKPASRVRGVLDAVRQLLLEPNPDDPLEARIADEFRQDRAEFDRNARAYVQRYAVPGAKGGNGGGGGSGAK
ncbi:ubiquitin-conjugating enzyme [Xylariaceae sp. FL0016]|nr:ubiquitin-conjugating enzyme [Xylariaceae sp. FL0016]